MRLTPKEVVAFLATRSIYVSDDTVRSWCTRGVRHPNKPKARHILKSNRIGGRILILQTAVQAFIPNLGHVQE